MNLVYFADYARKRKLTPKTHKASNDNDLKETENRLKYFSDTGETLTPGERGQVLVVETHHRRSCYEF